MCSYSSARLSPSTKPHVFFMRSLALAPLPWSISCIFCACALLLPCRRPVSPAPAPYFLLADALPLLRRVLPLPRLRLVSPFPCSSVLISVSFRPRSKDPFVSTSRLFVSYPAFFFRLVPRVFSSRTPCPLVLSPGFFRPQPRVISSPIPELSFVCFRNLLLPRKRFSC